MMTV
jgi:guanylate kinase